MYKVKEEEPRKSKKAMIVIAERYFVLPFQHIYVVVNLILDSRGQ